MSPPLFQCNLAYITFEKKNTHINIAELWQCTELFYLLFQCKTFSVGWLQEVRSSSGGSLYAEVMNQQLLGIPCFTALLLTMGWFTKICSQLWGLVQTHNRLKTFLCPPEIQMWKGRDTWHYRHPLPELLYYHPIPFLNIEIAIKWNTTGHVFMDEHANIN